MDTPEDEPMEFVQDWMGERWVPKRSGQRYAVSYDLSPEMVAPVGTPDEWRLLDTLRKPLRTTADDQVPHGSHFVGEETRRVQVEDAETGMRYYIFQHVIFYDVPAPASPS